MPDRTYPDDRESSDEPFLFVNEWEDHRLVEEFEFLARLTDAVASEIAFRGDHPEHSDGTTNIRAGDTELYDLADEIRATRERFETRMRGDV